MNTRDIEQKLEQHKQIKVEASLQQKSQTMFSQALDQYDIQSHTTNSYHPKSRFYWIASKPAFAALLFVVILTGIFFEISTEKYSVAQTLQALQNIQTVRCVITNSLDNGEVYRTATYIWHKPDKLYADDIQHEATEVLTSETHETYWIDGDNVTIVDHREKTVFSGINMSKKNVFSHMIEREFIHKKQAADFLNIPRDKTPETHRAYHDNQLLIQYKYNNAYSLYVNPVTMLPMKSISHSSLGVTIETLFEWNIELEQGWDTPIIPTGYTSSKIDQNDNDELPIIFHPDGSLLDSVRFDMNPAQEPFVELFTITGNVQDEVGNPIEGVEAGFDFRQNQLINPTVTDINGNFTLTIPSDSDWLTKTNNPTIITHFKKVGYKSIGYRIDLDQYSPTANLNVVLKPGGSVTGKVVDEHGLPIEGARIATSHKVNDFVLHNYTGLRTVTNQNGEFTLSGLGLEQDEYQILVRAEKKQWQRVRAVKTNDINQTYELEFEEIQLKSITPKTIVVTDDSGNAISGVNIRSHPFFQRFDFDLEKFKTDRNGFFEMYVVGNDKCDVLLWKEGYGYEYLLDVELTSSDPLEVSLDKGVSMTLRIVDQYGNPVPNVECRFKDSAYRNLLPYFTTVMSDKNGMITISSLKSGNQIDIGLNSFKSENLIAPYNTTGMILEDIEVSNSNEIHTIQVTKPTFINGKVVFAGSKKPVPYFRIDATRLINKRTSFHTSVMYGYRPLVYNSSSGYFNLYLDTSPHKNQKDMITIEVFTGDGFFNIQAEPDWKQEFSIDELGKEDLLIEIDN